MAEWLIKTLVVGFFAWVVWSLLRPRYVFEILLTDGQPRVRAGKVTPAFVGQVADACRAAGISRGWVGGVRHGRRTALRFSRHFPPSLRQRLRNEWQTTG